MDYSFFDSLFDAVFVLNQGQLIIYTNQSGANLVGSSQRRIVGKKRIPELLQLNDQTPFFFGGEWGKDEPTGLREVTFRSFHGQSGRVQISIQPYAVSPEERHWIVVLRDVTLEETLHKKYHGELQQKEDVILELQRAQVELERYSKNLEAMVQERTREINSANQLLKAIMNSLGQGFLVFNSGGLCSSFFTRACEDILETVPAGKMIWDVLRLNDSEKTQFEMWVQAVFAQSLPFEDLAPLAPQHFRHSRGRKVALDYYPIVAPDRAITGIVVTATDRTAEEMANVALERERQFGQMVLKMIANRRQFAAFLENIPSLVDEIHALCASNDGKEGCQVDPIFRLLHTLEGEAATFSLGDLAAAAHHAQELLEPIRQSKGHPTAEQRGLFLAAIERLEMVESAFREQNRRLLDTLGLGRTALQEIDLSSALMTLQSLREMHVPESALHLLENLFFRESLAPTFRHYEDLAFSIAAKQAKRLRPFIYTGLETRVDLEPFRGLLSSLVHAFRNIIDHGVEPPEERVATHKPEEAQITVGIESLTDLNGRQIRIMISDDGRGIDAQKLRTRLPTFSHESDDEIIQHVFDDGISTRESAGEYSGRGVGMSAIRHEVQLLGGQVHIVSSPGMGTRLIITVPDVSRFAAQPLAAAKVA